MDARSPMSGGLDRVRSVVACCGAKTQIKLLHYQLRTTRNCSCRIHFEYVFQKVRDELIYCFADGILDEAEFVLLYDAYKSTNSIYPFWEYDEFSLDPLSSDECLADFRVEKDDIPRLAEAPRLF